MSKYKKSANTLAKIIVFILLITTLLIQSAVFASPINQVDNGIIISATEIEDYSHTTNFPIRCNISNKDYGDTTLKFRLFDLFTLKTVKAKIVEDEQIYLGGDPMGITIRSDGVIITGVSDVVTQSGLKSPTIHSNIAIGDMLLKLDDKAVDTIDDIKDFLRYDNSNVINATIRRGKSVYETSIEPAVDALSNEKRLGLFVKEEISGVGTLTYIKSDYSYGALGHNVSEAISNGEEIRGNIYRCSVVGVNKGARGNAGELRGFFNQAMPSGSINKNNAYGIYGVADKSWISNKESVIMASRFSARPGKAQIYTTIDGDIPQRYDVEIIKLNYQKSEAEKGMVLRVTDEKLLEKTGGIVQGMSGSPIIQDGKLIGAVTHVFLNDPTKGYGIYIDWMKDN